MSNTGSLNIANIQVHAEGAAEIDRANGTYESNLAANRYSYLWQSDHQTIPMGMNGNPEQFVDRMIEAIPGLNAIRIPFNIHSFNSDGTLDPQFERFLHTVAARGLQIIPVLADGGAQQFEGTPEQILGELRGEIFDDMVDAWQLMMSWMGDNPAVKTAVYGWELVNEPATYDRVIENSNTADRAAAQQEAVELYVQHMTELSRIVSEHSDARILVSAWGYGGDTGTLADTTVGGVSAVEALRTVIGSNLVWSLHYYPGWMETGNISSPGVLQVAWQAFLAPLGGDDAIFTEINANGGATYNPFQPGQSNTATALSLSWLKEHGVGIGWFPGVQTGSSGLAYIEADGGLRYLNQPSLAAALDGYSSGLDPADRSAGERVEVTLIEARLRNQIGDPDYTSGRIDEASYAGIAFGYSGNDTMVGSNLANNFLYGGSGNDNFLGGQYDDFIFGQNGDDSITSGTGVDHLFGGQGDDTIIGDSTDNIAYGGFGMDLFILQQSAHMVIVDYSYSQGDRWTAVNGISLVNVTTADLDGDGKIDFTANFSDGGKLDFLNQSGNLNASEILNGYSGNEGTPSAGVNRLGGSGADTLIGMNGDDTIRGEEGNDRLEGSGGNDSLYGGGGDDVILGGAGADRMDGGAGLDRISYLTSSAAVSVNLASSVVAGGDANGDVLANIEAVEGSAHADTLTGGAGDDQLYGADGADVLEGGAGQNQIYGGDGDDTINAGSGNEVIHGGAGSDVVSYNSATTGIRLNLAAPSQSSGAPMGDTLIGIEGIVGSNFDDVITGDAADNRLWGRAGNDLVTGAVGHDRMDGGGGNDSVLGGAGNDSLYGDVGNDVLIGDDSRDLQQDGAFFYFHQGLVQPGMGPAISSIDLSHDDLLFGGAGADRLFGGQGNDLLVGGDGNDRLHGGAGADRFSHGGGTAEGVDLVLDYDGVEGDVLVFTGTASGAADFSVIRPNLSATGVQSLAELQITHIPSGQIIWTLQDTGGLTSINIEAGGQTFDLMG